MRVKNDHLLAVAWWIILNSLDLSSFLFQRSKHDCDGFYVGGVNQIHGPLPLVGKNGTTGSLQQKKPEKEVIVFNTV